VKEQEEQDVKEQEERRWLFVGQSRTSRNEVYQGDMSL
jgi:hypothetical protein